VAREEAPPGEPARGATGRGDSAAARPGSAAPPGRPEGSRPVSGVGETFARTRDIVILAGLLLSLSFAFAAVLLQAWPPPPAPAGSAGAAQEHATRVRILFWRLGLLRDVRLFFVVAAAGGLGALVHVLRSLYEYVGNHLLKRRWLLMYVLEPYIGSMMALIVYFVLRGGLTTTTASSNDINPYGVAALAALVGMFAREAVDKMRRVFETVFTTAEKTADRMPTPAGRPSDPGPDR
jgi:hypothetical protein